MLKGKNNELIRKNLLNQRSSVRFPSFSGEDNQVIDKILVNSGNNCTQSK